LALKRSPSNSQNWYETSCGKEERGTKFFFIW
jgi:hypothetical protein